MFFFKRAKKCYFSFLLWFSLKHKCVAFLSIPCPKRNNKVFIARKFLFLMRFLTGDTALKIKYIFILLDEITSCDFKIYFIKHIHCLSEKYSCCRYLKVNFLEEKKKKINLKSSFFMHYILYLVLSSNLDFFLLICLFKNILQWLSFKLKISVVFTAVLTKLKLVNSTLKNSSNTMKKLWENGWTIASTNKDN